MFQWLHCHKTRCALGDSMLRYIGRRHGPLCHALKWCAKNTNFSAGKELEVSFNASCLYLKESVTILRDTVTTSWSADDICFLILNFEFRESFTPFSAWISGEYRGQVSSKPEKSKFPIDSVTSQNGQCRGEYIQNQDVGPTRYISVTSWREKTTEIHV